MPLDQTDAIILRSFPVGEQDKIVVFFSPDKGLLKGVAKGARKFGNRFGSSLEPMSLVHVFFHEKERKELVTLSHCDLLESFFEAQRDYKTAFVFAYFAELVEEFFPSRSAESTLFRLLLSSLHALKEDGDLAFITRYFEAWFLRLNGLLPDFRKCKKCRNKIGEAGWLSAKKDGVYCNACAPEQREKINADILSFLSWVKKNPPPQKDSLPFSSSQLESVKKILQGIIIYHLEKEPKSLRYLNS